MSTTPEPPRPTGGEPAVARALSTLPDGYRTLPDLKVPGAGDAAIDHLVIGPSGAWLVDIKAWNATLTSDQGMLWRGLYPIRLEVEAVELQAERAAGRLGIEVTPVLCFVNATLPEPTQIVGRTHVVALDALVDHIASAPAELSSSEIDEAAHWASTMEVPSELGPDRRRGTRAAHATPASTGAVATSDATADRAGFVLPPRNGAAMSRLRRVALVVLLALLFMYGFPRLIDGLSDWVGDSSSVTAPTTDADGDPPTDP